MAVDGPLDYVKEGLKVCLPDSFAGFLSPPARAVAQETHQLRPPVWTAWKT